MSEEARLQYVAAYRAPNGNVIGIGEITGWREGAERDVREMFSPEDTAEVFVAYRYLPPWKPAADVAEADQ